jgi:hypothetical protein
MRSAANIVADARISTAAVELMPPSGCCTGLCRRLSPSCASCRRWQSRLRGTVCARTQIPDGACQPWDRLPRARLKIYANETATLSLPRNVTRHSSSASVNTTCGGRRAGRTGWCARPASRPRFDRREAPVPPQGDPAISSRSSTIQQQPAPPPNSPSVAALGACFAGHGHDGRGTQEVQ